MEGRLSDFLYYVNPKQALERRSAHEEAFALFDAAVRLSPDNALVRYRRAKLLIAMKKYNVRIQLFLYIRTESEEGTLHSIIHVSIHSFSRSE